MREPEGPDVPRRTVATLADADIEHLLDQLPALDERPRIVERITGGLTNLNVRVTTPSVTAIARISTSDSAFLAIDRRSEYLNSVAAAASGAAPPVLGYAPDAGVLLVQWVHGRTLGAQDVQNPANWERIVQACRRLHSGPRFVGDFDMFAVQARYLQLCTEHAFKLPTGYTDHLDAFDRVRHAVAVQAPATVPCNNDLLAENFVDDGERIWLIDYEYAGNNDPYFELGNIWSESNLDDDALGEIVSLYDGTRRRHAVARARLFALASAYGWTLWAAIQSAASTVDFDFWSWGLEKYERAVEQFRAASFPQLLEEAIAPD